MWNESVVANFKVLFQRLPEATEYQPRYVMFEVSVGLLWTDVAAVCEDVVQSTETCLNLKVPSHHTHKPTTSKTFRLCNLTTRLKKQEHPEIPEF